MATSKKITKLLAFMFMLGCAAPFAVASAQTVSERGSFGVGAVVVARTIDQQSLPHSVRQAEAHIPGYARQWYIARINLHAGRSIDGFVSWSRQALTQQWHAQSSEQSRQEAYRLVLASQRELMKPPPSA